MTVQAHRHRQHWQTEVTKGSSQLCDGADGLVNRLRCRLGIITRWRGDGNSRANQHIGTCKRFSDERLQKLAAQMQRLDITDGRDMQAGLKPRVSGRTETVWLLCHRRAMHAGGFSLRKDI